MIGRTLSHFKIVSRIGEGGMGVVYRAEDEKLHRPVALKVLPPDAVADEERRLRFLREARAAASLSHPNIAHIYEVDEVDGIVFIAMELIDGKTLRSALRGKPLSIRESLRIGIEIAEGLAKAHQARVVHRDLKPENVMVTVDGHVKILDFGLAKLLERDEALSADEASRLATISGEMTKQGRILGTAAYMSPEQARGQAVDSRSDLFAFGIVLYEMVTGRAPFHGPTPMDTLSAILSRAFTPAVQLNAEVPSELDRILGKCLEKDPAERYQDTRDLAVDLKRLKRDTESQPLTRPASGPVVTAVSGPATAPPRAGTPSPAAGAPDGADSTRDRVGTSPARVGSASPAIGPLSPSPAQAPGIGGPEWSIGGQSDPAVAGSRRGQADPTPAGSTRSQIFPPVATGQQRSRAMLFAVGTLAVIASLAWLGWRYWPSPASQQPPRELKQRQVFSDTPGKSADVSISPDGRYLALAGSSGLSVRQLESGEVRQLPLPKGLSAVKAAWTGDGTKLLVVTSGPPGKYSIWSMPLLTGEPRLIRGDCGWPIPSPDGKLLAFMTFSSVNVDLWVMDLQGGSARRIFTPANGEWFTGVAWAPNSRRIVYQLSRVPPEGGMQGVIESRKVDGGTAASILVEPRLVLAYGGGGGIQWLPDGRLFFSLSEQPPNNLDANIWSLDVDPVTGLPEGKPQRITSWAGGRPGPVGATADGKRLLVERGQALSDIWYGELEGGGIRLKAPRRLTFDIFHDRPSFWMPDSRRIVFITDRNGSLDLLVQNIEGGDGLPLVIGPEQTQGGRILPQEDSFLFVETPAGGNAQHELTVKRADLSGGSIETMFKLPDHETDIYCPGDPSASCLISELEGKEAVLYQLDPVKGKGKVMARIEAPNAPWFIWSLSSDGSRIAYLEETDSGCLVKILNLANSNTSELFLKGRNNVQSLAWAPDGKSLFAANNDNGKCTIFRVDLTGNIQVLVESGPSGEWLGDPMPSPDGHYLAYEIIGPSSDYWLLEGF